MIRVKNVSPLTLDLNGTRVEPGQIEIVPEGGVVGYAFKKGKIEIIRDNVILHEKTYLESLPMGELRKIGTPLGAKDTKKSELVSEILKKESEQYG
jgi:hypothetical protein